tara:strand:- start:3844 stop:4233 length:390 start_codon:yes stop_codon:yes gene_type:complete
MMPHEDRRERLDDRRNAETVTIDLPTATPNIQQKIEVTLGFYEDNRIGEVFITSGKEGTDIKALLGDASVLASLCLQYGVPPAVIVNTLGRVPLGGDMNGPTRPESPIGAAMELVERREAQRVAALEEE